jgi:arylsulfatase
MVGLTPPPHDWVGNDGKPIYFDSIDNSAYILGKAQHSARDSWVYIDGETFNGARADIGGDPKESWVRIAWKYLYTAKDSWLGAEANLGAIGATYNLTMDPYEKYDMTFNGAAPTRVLSTSPGKYAGQDNGWVLALISPVMVAFDKTVMQYPNIQRFVGGASTDLIPNLQRPDNPVPLLKQQIENHLVLHPMGGPD